MNFLEKIVFGTVLGGAIVGSPAFAQIPQDIPFIKAYPYFAHLDTGDFSPEQQGQIAQDLKNPDKFSKGWKDEDLNRIYARLTSGPIPSGFHRGTVITPMDSGLNILEKIGVPVDAAKLRSLANMLWKGKYFDPTIKYLKNRIDCSKLPMGVGGYGFIPGPVTCNDQGEGIAKNNLRFPAKVYCGQSLLDGRRESVIIDYAYGDDIKSVRPELWNSLIDGLPTKSGLGVRDEIRMVKPGFYLGRAHLKGALILWFTLEYDEEATAPADRPANLAGEDACWIGNQRQRQRLEAPGGGDKWGFSAYTNKGTLR